jgi:tetratricopeptide (TPR) repeat protein
MNETCCASPELGWQSGPAGDGFADQYLCSNCGTVHKSETWHAPLRVTSDSTCVNCGGGLAGPSHAGGEATCTTCGFTEMETQQLHDKLAKLHPDGDYLAAAAAASEFGRSLLALKLATAGMMWGEDHEGARALRWQALEGMGQLDRALDEAYGWTHAESTATLWRMIADLEGSGGNPEGALQALERALELDHKNLEIWVDYAELLHLTDSRPNAIEAAAYGLADPDLRERSLIILADIANKYYGEGMVKDAMGALSAAGEWQAVYSPLAWVRAQVAATQNNFYPAIEWLEITIQLDPDHEEAKAALKRLKPDKKKGLLGRMFGGKD